MAQQIKLFSIAGLKPALVRTFKGGYSTADVGKDLIAGLTVGVVALPLAMAFAIGAGASPAQGLYTAIIAGFFIALLGGSRYQVSGPTGAFVVIIADVIARHGMDGLLTATLLAGLILVFLGVSGLGVLIKYIPYPVTVGFTTGIGAIIFVGQLKDLFGLAIPNLSPEFFGKLGQYAAYATTISPWAALLGLGTIGIILFVRKIAPRIPAAVTAILVVSLLAWALGLPVETIGSKYGAIPRGFPAPSLPALSLEKIREVFPSAVTIALLAAIESLLSAVVADGMTGDRHGSSMELVAQGVGNLLSALFGGIPATGAIARTATNIKAGARSPISGIMHAFVLLLFTLFLGPLASAIPLAALAGVLVVVAMDMSELPRFFNMRRAPRSDLVVMLVTFALTVVIDLTAAVEVGVLLAIFLFIKRMSETTNLNQIVALTPLGDASGVASDEWADAEARLRAPQGCEVYEIDGPFFFGVADMLQDAEREFEKPPVACILRMRRVPAIDATGLNALSSFAERARKQGTTLILTEVREQPREAMAKMGLDEEIGIQNIAPDLDGAYARVEALVAAHERAVLDRHGRPNLSTRTRS